MRRLALHARAPTHIHTHPPMPLSSTTLLLRTRTPTHQHPPTSMPKRKRLLIAPTVQFNLLVILAAWQLHQHQLKSRRRSSRQRERASIYARTHPPTHTTLTPVPLPRRRILQKTRVPRSSTDTFDLTIDCHALAPTLTTRSVINSFLRLFSPFNRFVNYYA
jgi:hypothetical protein